MMSISDYSEAARTGEWLCMAASRQRRLCYNYISGCRTGDCLNLRRDGKTGTAYCERREYLRGKEEGAEK